MRKFLYNKKIFTLFFLSIPLLLLHYKSQKESQPGLEGSANYNAILLNPEHEHWQEPIATLYLMQRLQNRHPLPQRCNFLNQFLNRKPHHGSHAV